jgi:hypothetical protein
MILFRTAAVFSALLALPAWAGEQWPSLRHRAQPFEAGAAGEAPLAEHDRVLYQSPHSPGILVRMKTTKMSFFAGLDQYGAEGPKLLWARTAEGVKAFRPGERLSGADMTASWLLTSFQGARGWEQFDVPWFLALERKPVSVMLTGQGLELELSEADSGFIYSMPLYGYDKPPQRDNRFAEQNGLPSRGLEPWTWAEALPAEVAARCDWWAAVGKAYPIGFQESFRVDPSDNRIDFRQQYRWLTVADDWNTEPRRFALLPPSVALVRNVKRFPLEVSAPLHDADYWTAYGPLAGVVDADGFEYSLRLLQYLHEVEVIRGTGPQSAAGAAALAKIRTAMETKFPRAWEYRFDHGDRSNLCWNLAGDVWYGRALSLLEPALQGRAAQSMGVYMADEVLQPHSPYHGKYLLHGPGIGSWGESGDAGKLMSVALQPIWAYAAFGGDWKLIRQRWDLIQRFFVTPDEADWLSYGRRSIAEIGDEAAPAAAYARLALGVGDVDEYLFGAYMFSRELVHLAAKLTAGRQFYEHQPYHELEPMPERIYPTDMWGSTVGWQVDGPRWGHLSSGEHQSANRWVRFQDPEVGRFVRDRFAAQAGEELDWYDTTGNTPGGELYRPEAYRKWRLHDDPHGMPSRLRLQSLLLDEGPEGARAQAELGKLSRGWPAADIAGAYAVLRLNAPRDIRRTAPLTEGASPWTLGLSRRGLQDSGSPVQEIRERGLALEPLWYGWGMPRNAIPGGGRGYRSFGLIRGEFGPLVSGAAGGEWVSYGVQAGWADTVKPRTVSDAGRILREQDKTPVLVAGGFSNENDNEILNSAYAPEQDPEGVRWTSKQLQPGRRLDLSKELRQIDGAPALAYVLQYVWSPSPAEVFLSAGSQGGLVAWINDRTVIRVHAEHRPSGDDAHRGVGRLAAGWNRLLLKTESFTDDRTLQFRLTGLDGAPLPELRFSDRRASVAESGGL